MAAPSSSSMVIDEMTKGGAGSTMEQPWLEKYRPAVLDDVVGNKSTIERLKVGCYLRALATTLILTES